MDSVKDLIPKRIICLTEEFTEIIYLLGREDLIVGISGFTVRPPRARKEKPKVCTYLEADFDKIEELKPDLIFAFSDLQAEIVKELIIRGYNVYCGNQRSIKDILQLILFVGKLIGEDDKAAELTENLINRLNGIKKHSEKIQAKPRVYFEEWYDPLISGIRWVEELIEVCGGINIFPELKDKKAGKERIITSEQVIEKNPDIIIGSWCGKMVKKDVITGRNGWEEINAVKYGRVYEIKSSVILQPGPASLTEGADEIQKIISDFKNTK